MTKDDVRRALRARRREFVSALRDGRTAAEAAMAERLVPLLADVGAVALYQAIGAEIDVGEATAEIAERGVATALPRIGPDGMRFRAWKPGDPLLIGPAGIAEPAPGSPEIVPLAIVTPLVGFTRDGGRLGQGGGHYDRAFAAHPTARRIGVAWSIQEVDALPLDPWDMPLHAIVTERELIEVTP